MLSGEKYVAFDLGAESGRVMLGVLDQGHVALHETHRFTNRPVQVLDGLHWNVLGLWQEMVEGLARLVAEQGSDLAGIGVDTWGVDYALLDRQGALLGLPYHYRDKRTAGIEGELFRHYSEWELYARTGMAFAPHNTLCQLLAMRRQGSQALDAAHSLLMMPALFNYWLCGRQANETTIAGTTQFHDLWVRGWSQEILEKLGIPGSIPAELVPTCTVLGPLLPAVAQEVGLSGGQQGISVIVPACHDTPAAASVVPSQKAHATFISSGTWSVVGTELNDPLISPKGLAGQFMVEMAACGRLILAHKGAKEPDDYKKRVEVELEIGDAAAAEALLTGLGYQKALAFNKRRRTWQLHGCEVALDELPLLGTFVEIEGPHPGAISRVQTLLGLSGVPHTAASYATLIDQALARLGREPREVYLDERK